MTSFERQLKRAMARKEPPPDFTRKVLTAVAQQQTKCSSAGWWHWLGLAYEWRLLPALAALLLIAAGAIHVERERVARGEQAKEKLLLAMRIAGSRLNEARHRVVEIETAH